MAERQGRTAARNILEARERFDAVPTWSQHYDIRINYVGHAENWDAIGTDGDLAAHDAMSAFKKDGRTWRWRWCSKTRRVWRQNYGWRRKARIALR